MTETELHRLVSKHRQAGIVVDTQLLLLLLIGSFDPREIMRCKRTASDIAEQDFRLLHAVVDRFARIITTPNILTEIDNLADSSRFRAWWVGIDPRRLVERLIPSGSAMRDAGFMHLGLADSTIVQLARRRRLVLTKDFDLYHRLAEASLPVINFTHLQAEVFGWQAQVDRVFSNQVNA